MMLPDIFLMIVWLNQTDLRFFTPPILDPKINSEINFTFVLA